MVELLLSLALYIKASSIRLKYELIFSLGIAGIGFIAMNFEARLDFEMPKLASQSV